LRQETVRLFWEIAESTIATWLETDAPTLEQVADRAGKMALRD
jgi:hypothetical protein